MKTVGQKIRERRKQCGMTLEELGKACGSTKAYMWEMETKPSIKSSAERLNKIASALSVPISYLIDDNQQELKDNSEEIFLAKYRKLNDKKKKQLLEIMDVL